MANFAKDLLLKYGWTEGKGLGKNENGVTEPVKIMTNQNKAGIGYDETEPWWEKLFNNAARNVIVKSDKDDEVSLSVANDTSLFKSQFQKAKDELDNLIKPEALCSYKICTPTLNQLNTPCCNKITAVHKPYGSSLGKLERIAEQDRKILNRSPLITTLEEMDYRKKNVESDMEEHELDNNKIMLQSEAEEHFACRSKTTKKKHRKRINKLVNQLSTCNLQENNVDRYDFLHKKLRCSQKIENGWKIDKKRKHKEKKEEYSRDMVLNCLKTEMNELDHLRTISFKKNGINLCRPGFYILKSVFFDGEKRIEKTEIKRCRENDGDNIRRETISLNPEFQIQKNTIEKNRVIEKQCKDWVIDLETEKQQKAVDYNMVLPICMSEPSVRKNAKLQNVRNSFKHNVFLTDEIELKKRLMRKVDNGIQKKKPQHSKHIKEITEKLKNEALTLELNSVIKDLTTIGLAEEVDANTIKKRPTQTHLTPV